MLRRSPSLLAVRSTHASIDAGHSRLGKLSFLLDQMPGPSSAFQVELEVRLGNESHPAVSDYNTSRPPPHKAHTRTRGQAGTHRHTHMHTQTHIDADRQTHTRAHTNTHALSHTRASTHARAHTRLPRTRALWSGRATLCRFSSAAQWRLRLHQSLLHFRSRRSPLQASARMR